MYAKAVEEMWRCTPTCSWLLLRDGREEQPAPVDDLQAILVDAARRLKAL
jgi:hypothetical protein